MTKRQTSTKRWTHSDGDGNRVKETVRTVTTSYLVADQNPTGYGQVLDELQGGAVTRTYTYGPELINETQRVSGSPTTSFYGFDGHGSARFLTDPTGATTDTYDYDAFQPMPMHQFFRIRVIKNINRCRDAFAHTQNRPRDFPVVAVRLHDFAGKLAPQKREQCGA